MIPILVVISLLAFIISVNAPGDPVDRLLSVAENPSGESTAVGGNREQMKTEIIERLGLDLPMFYLGFGTAAENRKIHQITDNGKRKNLLYFSRISGRPNEVFSLDSSLLNLEQKLKLLNASDSLKSSLNIESETAQRLMQLSTQLLTKGSFSNLEHKSDSLLQNHALSTSQYFKEDFTRIEYLTNKIINEPIWWKAYVPKIEWFGLKNQYHRWVFGDGEEAKGVIRGDFGVSYRDGQKISERIGKKVKWSLLLAVVSVFLAYLISIPVGLYAGYHVNGKFDKLSSFLLFALYSLPGFFIGTLLLVLFANPDILDWFPESGIKDPSVYDPNWNFFNRLKHHAPYLILPIITYTYSSFAFISRQMRGGIVDVMKLDFIRTARAKGLSERRILTKHAFRNALLPIITIFSSIFPVAFGGSIIIETIFSIPGMGLEIYESIQNYDYPMIVAVFTIFGFLTIMGYFIGDLLYAAADPRIKLTNQQ